MILLRLTGRRMMAGSPVDQPMPMVVNGASIAMAMPYENGSLVYTTGPTLLVTASPEEIADMIDTQTDIAMSEGEGG